MKKTVIAVLIVIAVVAAFIAGFFANVQSSSKAAGEIVARTLQEKFIRVADVSAPAVVVIHSGHKVNPYPFYNPYDGRYYYKNNTPQEVMTGQGSGFFVRPDGYILTNYHIVKGQDIFTITLHNGQEYKAKLAGSDPASDLAVLKIDTAEKFHALQFADTDKISTGQWVVAIGAPFSLSHTVTAGIISHKRRTVGMNIHENFVQTDASINPGNSGGPLLDLEGRVVGVNDFILSPSRGNIGLGFAIAGNLAKRISDELIAKGKVERPWLGISMFDLNRELKQNYGVSDGVMVMKVFPDGPADRAGIKVRDIITGINGKKVNSAAQIQSVVASSLPGTVVKLKLVRNGTAYEVNVKTDKMGND